MQQVNTPPTATTTKTHDWLLPISDVVRSFNREDQDGELMLLSLPVCAVDCTVGERYYIVLGAWCVSWPDVPKAPFLKAWFALGADRRRALVQERKVFADELCEDSGWMERLLIRDDAEMLVAAALHTTTTPDGGDFFQVDQCIRLGATNCLSAWAAHQGWTHDDWAKHMILPKQPAEWQYWEDLEDLGRMREACDYAAAAGQLAMLQLLRAHGCPWHKFTCVDAAKGGSRETLQYLHERGCPWDENMICEKAAYAGHIECLRYAHDNGCTWDALTCANAAAGGHLEVVRYLHDHGCPWEANACGYAAEDGHVAVLQYLHEHGCPWNVTTCENAAMYGHFDCLEYAHKQGCSLSARVCSNAARGGHLECLRYAHENGCPWDDRYICFWAAGSGHLACLRYAHENGASIGDLCNTAHLECIKYLHENGCPWNEHACTIAAAYGSLESLKYLHENGCPWNSYACDAAARGGHLDCLQYLHENGCRINVRTAATNREEIRTWIDATCRTHNKRLRND